jgi:hypothetical protein
MLKGGRREQRALNGSALSAILEDNLLFFTLLSIQFNYNENV